MGRPADVPPRRPPLLPLLQGYNTDGRVGDGTTTHRYTPVEVYFGGYWVAISGGSGNTCGIRTDASLWCWGYNGDGRVGDGTLANKLIPVLIRPDLRWLSISAGWTITCGVVSNGSSYCWGPNTNSNLGTGSNASPNNQRTSPTLISTAYNYSYLAVSDPVVCALPGSPAPLPMPQALPPAPMLPVVPSCWVSSPRRLSGQRGGLCCEGRRDGVKT